MSKLEKEEKKHLPEQIEALLRDAGSENIADDLQLIYYRCTNFILDTEDVKIDDSRIMYTLRNVIEAFRGKYTNI